MAEISSYVTSLASEIAESDLLGRDIYLIGSGEFGPVNEPVLCRSTAGVKKNFGSKGTLYDAFHKLKYVSRDNNVYLVKTTGTFSRNYLNVNIPGGAVMHHGFILESTGCNEAYNEIKIVIDLTYIRIETPDILGGMSYEYRYADYPYIEMFADAITNTEKCPVRAHFRADPMTPTASAFYPCNVGYIYLSGGSCGLYYTKNMLYNCLERTYSVLESLDIDFIVPVDAFMDDVHPDDMKAEEDTYGRKYYQAGIDYLSRDTDGKPLSYMNQLMKFCIRQLDSGVITCGIMGFRSMKKNYTDIYNESNELADMWLHCFKYNYSLCEYPFYSFLISVVAGDIKYNKKYVDNGYLAYAALCAETLVIEGTTNVVVSDTVSLYHELEQEYLEKLADSGIVTFRQSPLFNQTVVYDGVTACIQKKGTIREFMNFANFRMAHLAVAYLNKLFQGYVGENIYSLVETGIMYRDINLILSELKDRNALTSYDFSVKAFYKRGLIKVYLNLETLYMAKPVTMCPVIEVEYSEDGVIA